MTSTPARRAYQTLDGLRGVGAFLVVMRHVPAFFGGIRVPESFLAVDLFYLVSGFVVAHAYGERLKAGGFFKAFVKTRIIRLYPLYLMGLAIGVVAAVTAIVTDPAGWWTWNKLFWAASTGLFLIPGFPLLPANGSTLDGPTWTLLPELIANAVYALFIRFMNLWVIAAIILVSGAGVVFAEFRFHGLDVGYSGTDQWAALARVGFSFFMGVLLFRLFGAQREHKAEWLAWTCMALLTLLLAFQPAAELTPWFELGVVAVGFPALLVVAIRYEPGAWTGRMFSMIGLVSYGVYIVHQPIGNLGARVLKRFNFMPQGPEGWLLGAVFLTALVGFAWWLDRAYDAPVRKALRARFMG